MLPTKSLALRMLPASRDSAASVKVLLLAVKWPLAPTSISVVFKVGLAPVKVAPLALMTPPLPTRILVVAP